MKIAVYPGSFNPLHIGHLAIMKCLTEEMDFDRVYLIVSPQNPFKGEELRYSGLKRYEAAVMAVARHPELKVSVDDIELHMPAPQYTIRTLDALSAREPENSFTLVIGADNLDAIRRWKDSERILTEYGVVVYPRKGFDIEAVRLRLLNERDGHTAGQSCLSPYRIRTIDAPMVEISSSEIRRGIAEGRNMEQYLM